MANLRTPLSPHQNMNINTGNYMINTGVNVGYSPITPGHNFMGTQSPGLSTHQLRSMSPNFNYTKMEVNGSPNMSNLSSDVINSHLGSVSPN
jgi:hypothetical protein